jgi:hypothetical protein
MDMAEEVLFDYVYLQVKDSSKQEQSYQYKVITEGL